MYTSYNNIIKQIKTFATDHPGINGFESMPITENISGNLYPLMWLELTGIKLNYGCVNITMNVNMLDLIKTGYSNWDKVMSDTLRLCTDFSATFSENEETYGFYIDNDINIEQIGYDFGDDSCGQQMSIIIKVGFDNNSNHVPN